MDSSETITKVQSRHHHALSVILRHEVFSNEQGWPIPADFDEKEDDAIYYVTIKNGEAIATARYRTLSDKEAKIEQMAVKQDVRKSGHGRKLIDYIHQDLRQNGFSNITLNSQLPAEGFYKSVGYTRDGDIFKTAAGLDHYKMVLKLSS